MENRAQEKGKRLLYVASTFDHINSFHLEYISALQSEGSQVHVLARGEGADFDIPFEKKIFSPKNLSLVRKIRLIIRRGGYGAILLNTSLAAFYVRLALPRRGRPHVVNFVHGYLFSEGQIGLTSLPLLLAEYLLRRKTDAVITMNREDLEIAKKFRLTRGRVYLTRGMGAVVKEIITPPEALRREFFPHGAFVLCFVGELSERKNQSFLIKALAKMKKDIPNAVLCLVGDGNKRASLTGLSASLGITDSVIFTGFRRDACDFLRACDLYVSASRTEGLPFNVIEALGVGKTVLISSVKGHCDIIDDGVDGFLYTPNNMEDFLQKALKIHGGELSPNKEKIAEKYSKYEHSSVFPHTLSVIKESLA